MGEVYRKCDPKLNRDVAIKVLLPAVANDPDRLTRFSREAQVLASLNHPNHGRFAGWLRRDRWCDSVSRRVAAIVRTRMGKVSRGLQNASKNWDDFRGLVRTGVETMGACKHR
jgi:serine/threonine protein kinase